MFCIQNRALTWLLYAYARQTLKDKKCNPNLYKDLNRQDPSCMKEIKVQSAFVLPTKIQSWVLNLSTSSVVCGCSTIHFCKFPVIDWQWKSERRTVLRLLCEIENDCWSTSCQIPWLQGSMNKLVSYFFPFTCRKSLHNSLQKNCPYETGLKSELRPEPDLRSSSDFTFYILKLSPQIQISQCSRVWPESVTW